MPNPTLGFGLKPVRHRSGAPYTGAANAYKIGTGDSTALAIGDPVQLAGSSIDGVPTITRATAGGGNFILGAVVGFEIDQNIRANGFRAATTAATVLVADNPDLLFEIREDSDSENVLAAEVGLNADLVAGSLSTVTRDSGFKLDSSTAATTNTLQLRIEGIVNDGQNETADTDAAKRLYVSINLHQRRNTTGI